MYNFSEEIKNLLIGKYGIAFSKKNGEFFQVYDTTLHYKNIHYSIKPYKVTIEYYVYPEKVELALILGLIHHEVNTAWTSQPLEYYDSTGIGIACWDHSRYTKKLMHDRQIVEQLLIKQQKGDKNGLC